MKKIYNSQATGLHLPPGYGPYRYEIKTINLKNIVDNLWGIGPTRITETPHYKYVMGDSGPLEEYFQSCKGHTWGRAGTAAENMTVKELISEFDVILQSEKDYLEPPYEKHYIIVGSNWHCIDGLRRACTLLGHGIEEAPVAWVY